MAVQRQYQAVISVLDRTAAPLRAIQLRLAGLAPASLNIAQRFRFLGDRLREMAQQPAFQNMAAAGRRVGEAVATLTRRVALLGAAFVGVGLAAGAAFVRMGTATMMSAGRLADLAARTGMTVEQLRGLEYVGAMAGMGVGQTVTAVEKLNNQLAQAATGRNANLAALFEQLRIPMRNANGEIRSAVDLLPELAEAFRLNTNPARQAQMAVAIFGEEGLRLIGALSQGRDALRAQMAQGFALNPQITDRNLAAIDRAEDAVAKLRLAFEGLRDAVFVRLLPALAEPLEKLTEWVRLNQDLVGTRVAEWVTLIADRVKEFDLNAFLDRLERWARLARDVFHAIGGIEGALVALAAVMLAPGIVAIAGLVATFGTWALTLAPGAPLLLGIGALALAAVTIYQNWEPLAKFFTDLWATITGGAEAALAKIREIVQGARDLLRFGGSSVEQLPDRINRDGINRFLQGQDGGVPLSPGQQLFQPQSFTPGAPAGNLDIRVRFDDLPRGARVDVQRAGAAPEPRVDVGYSMLGAT